MIVNVEMLLHVVGVESAQSVIVKQNQKLCSENFILTVN